MVAFTSLTLIQNEKMFDLIKKSKYNIKVLLTGAYFSMHHWSERVSEQASIVVSVISKINRSLSSNLISKLGKPGFHEKDKLKIWSILFQQVDQKDQTFREVFLNDFIQLQQNLYMIHYHFR